MISIRFLTPDDWQQWRLLRHSALAGAPHAFSSKLADWQGDGDREERWRDRLATVALNVIADVGGRPVGTVSGSGPRDGEVELMSMWVEPEARGAGVGDALVAAVCDWAKAQGARRVVLQVVADNDPALNLYRRHGFSEVPLTEPNGPCEVKLARTLDS